MGIEVDQTCHEYRAWLPKKHSTYIFAFSSEIGDVSQTVSHCISRLFSRCAPNVSQVYLIESELYLKQSETMYLKMYLNVSHIFSLAITKLEDFR